MSDDLVSEALEAQGFKAAGPKLVRLVTDALVREQEVAEARSNPFSFSEIVADTPEILERTEGPIRDSPLEISRVLAGVITEAIRYVLEDCSVS